MLFCYDQVFCYSREQASAFLFFLLFFLSPFPSFFIPPFFSLFLFFSLAFFFFFPPGFTPFSFFSSSFSPPALTAPWVALTFWLLWCLLTASPGWGGGAGCLLPAAPGWLPHERGDGQGALAAPLLYPPNGHALTSPASTSPATQPIMLQSDPSLFLPPFFVTLRSPARGATGSFKPQAFPAREGVAAHPCRPLGGLGAAHPPPPPPGEGGRLGSSVPSPCPRCWAVSPCPPGN